jgi:hypothetical protein
MMPALRGYKLRHAQLVEPRFDQAGMCALDARARDGFKSLKIVKSEDLKSEDLERAMARKHRFRFGFHGVFAGRLLVSQGRRWPYRQFGCCGCRFGALGR